MFLDVSPLRKYRDYRYLFTSQIISMFGSMVTYVALPLQIYELTHSTIAVGILSAVELVPLFITALIGGVFADAVNRKRLLLFFEFSIMLVIGVLAINAALPVPKIWVIYCAAGIMSALNGFHRPALGGLGPSLVEKADIPAYSALNSFNFSLSAIIGPIVGGFLATSFGWVITYLVDVATFAISIFALSQIRNFPKNHIEENTISFRSFKEGLSYVINRQELTGTYVIDMIAMVFSMPVVLFPAVADSYAKGKLVGFFYSAIAIGALVATVFSKWMQKIHYQGWAIVIAASCWGLAMTGFALVSNIWLALFILVIAGGVDAISSIFRSTIWNQTIPSHFRGRLAGIEMIGYTSGPLLGGVQAGMLAAVVGIYPAIMLGGVLCILGVGVCAKFLPRFLHYEASL